MTKEKRLGIWMDHSIAHLMEFSMNDMETTLITSDFTRQVKEETLSKSEHVMHHKEQQLQGDYYKKLGDVIGQYEQVLLFGPTDAKSELANLLKVDHHFDKIHIELRQSDKMTEHQEHAFVRDFFHKHV